MAFSKITTRGMSGDTLEAGDIAANAVGASELADNAVDAGAIASGEVTAAKVADGLIEVKPHIKPGLLHPAWKGLLPNHTPTSNTFTDSSASAHTLYLNDNQTALNVKGDLNIHHSAVTKKTGNSSIRFDGVRDTIWAADHADWDFGAGSGTIEFWFYPQKTGRQRLLSSQGGSHYWILWFGASARKITLNTPGGAEQHSSTDLALETWHHVAIVKDGTSTTKVYCNGADHGTLSNHNGTWSDSTAPLYIGRGGATGGVTEQFQGYMDEIRITKGVANYTGAFTPPTALTTTWSAATGIAANSTAGNVKLLIHSNAASSIFHSGAYGTAQSDGLSYYYTDIKGSEPIEDPRIGAHFGSQRHMLKSLQKQDKLTQLNGESVHYVDGRKWFRVHGDGDVWTNVANDAHGIRLGIEAGEYIEVVGYFNAINFFNFAHTSARTYHINLDGANAHNAINPNAGVEEPKANRYFTAGSIFPIDITASGSNLASDTTLGIHTIQIQRNQAGSVGTNHFYGVEFSAQDTTDTASRSKIQIPSQNVISYGKKYSIGGSSAATHYNPFDGWSGAKTSTELATYIDTATSLGMEHWKAGTSNYYKPFQGGRVVKWVDSSGTIKTSVNMMPPNAQNINGVASNAISTSEVQNSTNGETINFDANTIDMSLQESAKTYFHTQFGNGAANEGYNTSGTKQDFSMLNDSDNLAFTLDDGLTSCAGNSVTGGSGIHCAGDNTSFTIYFIGTGISMLGVAGTNGGTDDFRWYVDGIQVKRCLSGFAYGGHHNVAQNLPYGTHTFRVHRVTANTSGQIHKEFNFYQPKMPPIPADACILADYMLMADFVAQNVEGIQNVSKGTRYVSPSRDIHYDCGGTAVLTTNPDTYANYRNQHIDIQGHANNDISLMTFSTRCHASGFNMAADNPQWKVNGTNVTGVTGNGGAVGGSSTITPAQTLGMNNFAMHATADLNFDGYFVATPTHTSHHYQEQENPVGYELVGGDRNMEQTNLVVTADGKTWDKFTREDYYKHHVGAKYKCVFGRPDTGNNTHLLSSSNLSGSMPSMLDEHIGFADSVGHPCFWKGIMHGPKNIWVPETGWYRVSCTMRGGDGTELAHQLRNDTDSKTVKQWFSHNNSNDNGGLSYSSVLWMIKDKTYDWEIVGGWFRQQYGIYSQCSIEWVGDR